MEWAPSVERGAVRTIPAAIGMPAPAVEPEMLRLKHRLTELRRFLPPGRPVLYLDYPVHLNVGDQLINLGTECFLADNGYQVVGRYSLFNCPDDIARRIPADAIILLHGGGNLGDLYPDHEAFREKIVARCHGHRIIVLPQTLHFSDAAGLSAAAAVYRDHPDLILCVRDHASLAKAAGLGREVLLLPDMAHQLWRHAALLRLRRRSGPASGTLRFFRKDQEAVQDGNAAADWADWETATIVAAFRGLRKAHFLAPRLRGSLDLAAAWYRFRDLLIAHALRRFGNPAVVETDRLHACLLAALLERPVRLYDNSYGKNSGYYAAWLAGHEGIWYCGTGAQ
jgi:pyruvyl transferase EpsO